MKIGIIREGKTPPDKRVPFSPDQCKKIVARYPQVELLVQKSAVRAFDDAAYENAGPQLVDDLSAADVIFGVKEVLLEELLADKTYFFFSHTIKKQPYNRELLQTVLKQKIKLVDYECLTTKSGHRLVGFGRYAGIVGTYNAFLAYGQRSGRFQLKPAHECADRKELEQELKNIELPKNYKLVITGLGRVAGGAKEILEKLGIKEVSAEAILSEEFDQPVFSQLSVEDYFKKKDGSSFTREEAYENSALFESDFFKFAKVADLYITCHYWDAKGPIIFTKEQMQSEDFNIRVIADISCDIDGPIPSTVRPSTIEDPIYEYHRKQLKVVDNSAEDTITVMAVDNLPCELPKDASEDFGEELMKSVLPNLLVSDNDAIIERATIAEKGALKPSFSYLDGYVKGED
ncbi:MAG: NAD(P)-dependent oxidoreductase [Vicingaceae bacterium]